ncbi:MAG: twin-arginine translocation signal domain-containing protein [Anaerolineae bacterium]|nr:twin-arginine translocation signal domain-containing protein [Anaerolineae bacterium]
MLALPMKNTTISRREFLKLAALGVGAFALPITSIPNVIRKPALASLHLPDFPVSKRLGRVLVGKTKLKLAQIAAALRLRNFYEKCSGSMAPGGDRD